MSKQYAKIIVNPAAGGHSIHRDWPSISRHLKENGLIFDYVFTEGAGHATELAKHAADTGCKYVIAVGGDGTISEVVNGILSSAHADDLILGIVSAGTACSFARSVNIPMDLNRSSNILIGGKRMSIDVGIVNYMSKGQHLRRYFVNEVDLGFGATVVQAAKTIPNYFGRKANYLPYVLGGLESLFLHKNKPVSLHMEDNTEYTCDCAMMVIANGAYFGGGMCLAPGARPNDGLLDMIIFGNMSKSEMIKIFPLTYQGHHINQDKVRLQRITSVSVQCDKDILVEADGELLGEGPASFAILPSALNIVVP